jgi:hypothetical protein
MMPQSRGVVGRFSVSQNREIQSSRDATDPPTNPHRPSHLHRGRSRSDEPLVPATRARRGSSVKASAMTWRSDARPPLSPSHGRRKRGKEERQSTPTSAWRRKRARRRRRRRRRTASACCERSCTPAAAPRRPSWSPHPAGTSPAKAPPPPAASRSRLVLGRMVWIWRWWPVRVDETRRPTCARCGAGAGVGTPARGVRETRGGDGIRTECTCCSVLA